jgi:DNA modification methylase
VLFKDSTVGRDVKRFNATPTNTFSARGLDAKKAESVSEFDPYLCELMYRWFSNKGDKILDPFAGGCVRGVVASVLGRDYCGIDLSPAQINANYNAMNIIKDKYIQDDAGVIAWKWGDSEEVLKELSPEFDMVFTCPPYYNLEKYSNDPKDLSNLSTYDEFLKAYTIILYSASQLLKPDSFFVVVVSEIRADAHNIANSQYLGFVPDTIKILQDTCGLKYYNEIILENAIGSLPIRAPKYFSQSRKIGRHHQNILVFYKGDITNITNKFGETF